MFFVKANHCNGLNTRLTIAKLVFVPFLAQDANRLAFEAQDQYQV